MDLIQETVLPGHRQRYRFCADGRYGFVPIRNAGQLYKNHPNHCHAGERTQLRTRRGGFTHEQFCYTSANNQLASRKIRLGRISMTCRIAYICGVQGLSLVPLLRGITEPEDLMVFASQSAFNEWEGDTQNIEPIECTEMLRAALATFPP